MPHAAKIEMDGPAPIPRIPEVGPQLSRIATAISDLPREHRAVLGMHYMEGMDGAEIAAVLGRPVDEVITIFADSLQHLRELALL